MEASSKRHNSICYFNTCFHRRLKMCCILFRYLRNECLFHNNLNLSSLYNKYSVLKFRTALLKFATFLSDLFNQFRIISCHLFANCCLIHYYFIYSPLEVFYFFMRYCEPKFTNSLGSDWSPLGRLTNFYWHHEWAGEACHQEQIKLFNLAWWALLLILILSNWHKVITTCYGRHSIMLVL